MCFFSVIIFVFIFPVFFFFFWFLPPLVLDLIWTLLSGCWQLILFRLNIRIKVLLFVSVFHLFFSLFFAITATLFWLINSIWSCSCFNFCKYSFNQSAKYSHCKFDYLLPAKKLFTFWFYFYEFLGKLQRLVVNTSGFFCLFLLTISKHLPFSSVVYWK